VEIPKKNQPKVKYNDIQTFTSADVNPAYHEPQKKAATAAKLNQILSLQQQNPIKPLQKK